ncbi:hypothetical protein ACFWVU_25385 [Streptomyces sp. NPDC058686]|uniref:hypothetical protein n=1 Tax=Streptomyces sp. NPDC058686 TaxID=3346599 RepID=UPI003663D04D
MDSQEWVLQPAHRSEWTPTLCEHRLSDQQDNDCAVVNFCVYVLVCVLHDSREGLMIG